MSGDEQLLRQYAEQRSEAAFSELVSRHIDLVYSTAVRLLAGDTHLAQDVVQTVFTDLSLRTHAVRNGAALAGWLYRHTFFVASTTVRTEQRRRQREREAAQMNALDDTIGPNWDQLRPVLDEALQGLGTTDRNAIVLRYFQARDLKAVGAALGTNEDAAQKRVARALEKLRVRLSSRGVTLTGATLAACLTGPAVTAAPAGMAVHVAASILAGTGTGSGTAITWIKLMAWLKTKTALVSGAVILLTGVTGTYWWQTDSSRGAKANLNAPNASAIARAPDATPAGMAPRERLRLQWSQVESSDYRQYIANLRAIGCPEPTLRDIIVADLNQAYGDKMRAIWQRPVIPYWKKNRDLGPSPDQIKKFQALDQEKAGILKQLLGVAIDRQELTDIAYLQLHESDTPLLFLPAGKREAARQALQASGLEARIEKMREMEPHSDPERGLFDQKLRVLAQVLSADELEEYRLRNSPRAQWLRSDVQYLDCTPDQFKALLDLREQHLGPGGDRSSVDRATAIADVRNLLGEERAQEYARVSDAGYHNGRLAAEQAGLASELADQAGQIVYEARLAVEQLAKNTGLSVTERQRQAQALQRGALARLKAELGRQASLGIQNALRSTLDNTAQSIRP